MQQILFRDIRDDAPLSLREYEKSGGYRGLRRGLAEMSPEVVQTTVIDSGLRGRGGAGFPTGRKWSFVPRNLPGPRYLICNCDEMEPGTYKDRILLEKNPHTLVEGMVLASYALGVEHAFIFMRRGYEKAAAALRTALAEAKERGLLGGDIAGSGYSLEIDLHLSAGRYICGEETALINALEGRRPNPRSKPPFPAVQGLWKQPTVVNNVETLANLGFIVAEGAEAFRSAGVNGGAGTKLFCMSGHLKRTPCVELPIGVTLGSLVEETCGGMAEGRRFKACIPGGASTPYFTAAHFDVPMDFDPVAAAGSRLGTGGVVVFDDRTCMVAATLNLIRFFARESCGWCTPCREGLPVVREILTRLEAGGGVADDIPMLREHVKYLNYSFCALAPGAMGPVEGLLKHFEEELEDHVRLGRCPFS